MKRIFAFVLALVLCLSLCGCGEKSAKIDELKALVQESPYSCEEGEGINSWINIDIIEKYQTIVNELQELEVTTEECPELEYAQAVAGLYEYYDDVQYFYSDEFDDSDASNLINVVHIRAEINEKEDEIEALYEELQLGQD